MSFKINIQAFLETLPMMGKGMLGIFIVTGVIILTVVLLNKLTSAQRERDEEKKG